MEATQISTYKSAAVVHTTVNKSPVNKLPMSLILHYLIDKSKGEQKRYFLPMHEKDIPRLEGVTKKRILSSFRNASGQVVYLIDVTGLKLDPIDSSKTFHKGQEGNLDRINEAIENLEFISDLTGPQKPFLSSDTKKLFLELVSYINGKNHRCR
jgi:hypothetical protein